MATARAPTDTWVAREGELYLGHANLVNIGSALTLSGSFTTSGHSVTAACKNITITPPETSWEKQDFMGETSRFQNQLLDEKPVGLATLTGTLLVGEDETVEDYMTSGVSTAPTGFARYQPGKFQQDLVACVVIGKDPDQVSFAFDNAKATKWGDVRISGPDSHWEQDFTIVCLPKDFHYEFKD